MVATVAYAPFFAPSARVPAAIAPEPRPSPELAALVREIGAVEGQTVAEAPWLFRVVEVLGHAMIGVVLTWGVSAIVG
jgi:hypothetical protein